MKNYKNLYALLGLNPKESEVYEFLLQNGDSSVSQVSENTNISRTNTYNILDSLMQKELVHVSRKNKSYYYPAHPHQLNILLGQQEKDLQHARDELQNSMSDLLASYSIAGERPGVFRFEGRDGMYRVYDELLRDCLPVSSIMNREMLRNFIGEYNSLYVKLRQKHLVNSRVITPYTDKISSDDEIELREVRYLDPKIFNFAMDLKVTEKKVVMTTFKESTAAGILIIDPEISRNFLMLYEFLWSIAKP